MKKILNAFLIISFFALFLYGCNEGLEKEARRQCIVAMDYCEKYEDAGACNPEYMKVCDGVEL